MVEATTITPEFRVLFPAVFKPVAFKGKGGQGNASNKDPRFEIRMLFDPAVASVPGIPSLSDLKKMALAVGVEKWGAGTRDELKAGLIKWPFKSGDKEADKSKAQGQNGEFYQGMSVLNAHTDFAPQVVDMNKVEILNEKLVYSGSYGHASIKFVAGDVSGKYITVYFDFYMKSRDGDRIASRSAKDVFSGIAGGVAAGDPGGFDNELDGSAAAALDDEIPF